MSETLDPRLEADAMQAAELPTDLWARIEADLDEPGPRDAVVSLSTPVRRLLGISGVLAFGVGLVGLQGVREDLDGTGWGTFLLLAGGFVIVSLAASAFVLRSRASRPLPGWPWVPLAWGALLVGSLLPWPGMTGVPAEMHVYCFGATSGMVLASITWLLLLERAHRPTAWRAGLAAAGTGMAAFAFQSVFCPGVDLVHLIVGHGGAAFVWAGLAAGLAVLWGRR